MADDNIQRLRNTGRNDDCPCGSGKKYKKCHLREDEEKESKSLAKSAEEARKKAEKEGNKEDHTPQHPGIKHGHENQSMKPHAPSSVAKQVSAPRKAGTA